MILVTGGTGFVGPKIVHALRAEDRAVRCLVRNPSSGRARRLQSWGCELVHGDMANPESLNRAAEGCDCVVHLVAVLAGSGREFERVMAEGTRDLVAAAKSAGVRRWVHMSALGTGERTKNLTSYFRAKWEMERAVEEAGFDHTIFRPSFIFGRDGGVLHGVVRVVRYSPVVPVVGTRRLQPVWVEDVASFFARSLSTPAAVNRTFDLGGPDTVTWDELYDRVRRCLGKRRARVQVPIGLARAVAGVVEKVPANVPLSREAITMLEFEDNVCDIRPAVETFGVEPITLDEQIRRGV
ncbi:MAG: NAD(P)H-binding protein [Actinomycetota bacterium]|nr:NAD(P)H-binding protein [Actinomycetota bacterium]